jgi:hypothetical protein
VPRPRSRRPTSRRRSDDAAPALPALTREAPGRADRAVSPESSNPPNVTGAASGPMRRGTSGRRAGDLPARNPRTRESATSRRPSPSRRVGCAPRVIQRGRRRGHTTARRNDQNKDGDRTGDDSMRPDPDRLDADPSYYTRPGKQGNRALTHYGLLARAREYQIRGSRSSAPRRPRAQSRSEPECCCSPTSTLSIVKRVRRDRVSACCRAQPISSSTGSPSRPMWRRWRRCERRAIRSDGCDVYRIP